MAVNWAQPGMARDGLCVLREYRAPGQHPLEQPAEGNVDVWLRLVRQGATSRGLSVVARLCNIRQNICS